MYRSDASASHITVLSRRAEGINMHGDFAEIVGVDPTDPEGLIPLAISLQPLECRIPQWIPGPSPGRVETLKLWWRIQGIDVEADSQPFPGPLNPADFPYSLYVPVDYMREIDAVVQIYFTIVDETGFSTPSLPLTLRVDNNPPRFQDPDDKAQFVDPGIEATGITEEVLANNPFIEVLVPDFIGRAGRDRVGYYLDDNAPPVPAIQKGIQEFTFIAEPLVLRIPADDFRSLPNGAAHLQYRLYDRAGNFSGFSAPLSFQVSLIAGPSNLPAPQIRPPAYNDFLIKRDDARAIVAAVIPHQYDGFAPGDRVVMRWDGRDVLPAQTITGFPFTVSIPWDTLRGPTPLVRELVEVKYTIQRTGRPDVPSPSGFFWVDLTIAGQDHALAPARLNQTLSRVDVFGLGSGLHNELDLRDRDLGAQVWVRLYVGPVAGERLELYWSGAGPVAHYDVQPGDVFDQPVRFTDVPGSVIVAGGNHPQLPVFYITSNGVNEQDARNTLVNVHVEPLVRLNPPVIQHSLHGGANYLTCDSIPAICHGVIWWVRPDPVFQLNDIIQFFWQGYSKNNWEDPIDDTDFSFSLPLDANHLNAGVYITVLPWDTKIEPMRSFASATSGYSLVRNGAPVGESTPGRVRIDRKFSGSGKVCQPGDEGFCDNVQGDCSGNH
ncbi:hypothetical protein [Pseudomonas sp. HY7a-MNA-CIBAN-0227]|uniref:hypothetical protein n=1 Tax=Pseudomonas sp. HY7a-MNA-CIBAN-0227 TaxID=3140474 RepID=UPI003327E238